MVGTTWKGLGLTSSTTHKWSVLSNADFPRAMWKRNPRLEDHLKSTNLVIFMKFWITLRWEGIVTTDMGNNRPESKTTLSCFFLWRLHIRQLIENQTSFCLSHTLNKTKFGIVFPHHQEEELHQYSSSQVSYRSLHRGHWLCRSTRYHHNIQQNTTQSFGKGKCWLLKFVSYF